MSGIVLLVHSNPRVLRERYTALQQVLGGDHPVVACPTIDAAATVLHYNETAVFISDLSRGGAAFLRRMAHSWPSTRCIIVANEGQLARYAEDIQHAMARVLYTPFSNDDLIDAVVAEAREYIETGSSGIVSFSLEEMLQLALVSNRTALMRVWSGDKYGFLVVSHGNLLHAERDGIASLDGAYEILSWEDAHVVSVPQHTPPIETIRHPIRELLSEWARRQDERMHLARALKPNLERLSSLPHTIASMVVDVDNSRPIAAHVGGNVPQSVSEVAYAAERAIYKFVKATQTPTPGLEEVQSIAMTFPGFELVMAPITDTLALLVIADQNAAVSQIRIAAMSVAEDLRPFLSHSMQGRTTAIESA